MSLILQLLLILPLFASSALSDCCYSLDPTWLETSKYVLNVTIVDRTIALSSGSEYAAVVVFPAGYSVTSPQSCAPVASSATPTYICSGGLQSLLQGGAKRGRAEIGKGRKSLFVRFALDTTVNGLTNQNPSATVTVGEEQCTQQGFCNEPTDPGTSTVVDDSVVNLGFGVYPKPAVIVAGCVGGLFIVGLGYLLLRQRRRTGEQPDDSKWSARWLRRNLNPDAENPTGLVRTIQERQNAALDGKIPNEKGGGLVRPENKSFGGERRTKNRDEEKNPSSDAEPVEPSHSGGGASLTRVRSRGRRPQTSIRPAEPVAGDTMTTSTTTPSTPLGATSLQSSESKTKPTGRSVAPTGPSIRRNGSKKKRERAQVERSAKDATTREPVSASSTLDQLVVERTFPRPEPMVSSRSAKNPERRGEKTNRASTTAIPKSKAFQTPPAPSHDDDEDENVPLSILADRDNDDENIPLAILDERKPESPSKDVEESDEDLPLVSMADVTVLPRNQKDRSHLGEDDSDDQVPLSTLATGQHHGS